ncbi:hypothetical protein [Pseudomonas sp. Root562]|jgi:hypothetical protein|uniref:hypothetical protein n=1 Tax=Pseudomonas sp. Root562 TaxID=1736561 RepID=UPI000ABD1FFD|nr:hypothetical protein [Pseudomonas sp. Root562]
MHRNIQGSPYLADRVTTGYYPKTAFSFFAGKPRSYKEHAKSVGARLAREEALKLYG